jgi:hypothetical protein
MMMTNLSSQDENTIKSDMQNNLPTSSLSANPKTQEQCKANRKKQNQKSLLASKVLKFKKSNSEEYKSDMILKE